MTPGGPSKYGAPIPAARGDGAPSSLLCPCGGELAVQELTAAAAPLDPPRTIRRRCARCGLAIDR